MVTLLLCTVFKLARCFISTDYACCPYEANRLL